MGKPIAIFMTLKEKFESILEVFGETTNESFVSALSITNIYLLDRVQENIPEKLLEECSDEELDRMIDDYLINNIGNKECDEISEEFAIIQGELFELQYYLTENFDIDEYIEDILKNWNGELPIVMDIIEELINQSIHSAVLEDVKFKLTKNIEFEKDILEKEIIKLRNEFDCVDVSMICEYKFEKDEEGIMFNNTISFLKNEDAPSSEDMSDSLLIVLSSVFGKVLINCYNEDCDVCCIYGFDCEKNRWTPTPMVELTKTLDVEFIKNEFNRIEFRELKRKM